jgi:hypothetical protein
MKEDKFVNKSMGNKTNQVIQIITIKTAWTNMNKLLPISLKNSGQMEEQHPNLMMEK